jgi:general stress protein 26
MINRLWQLKWKRYEQEGNDDPNIAHLNIETLDDKEQVKLRTINKIKYKIKILN